MNLIAAADRNWAIGNKGQMLVSIPEDQKWFRQETLGKVVVMGRKTLESLPGGKPLYGRTNLVLSRDRDLRIRGAAVCHSIEEVLAESKAYPAEEVFIIGGQSVYEQFLPYCNTAYVTLIDYSYDADTYMPDLDQSPEWGLAARSEEQTYFDICYEFRRYVRRERKKSRIL